MHVTLNTINGVVSLYFINEVLCIWIFYSWIFKLSALICIVMFSFDSYGALSIPSSYYLFLWTFLPHFDNLISEFLVHTRDERYDILCINMVIHESGFNTEFNTYCWTLEERVWRLLFTYHTLSFSLGPLHTRAKSHDHEIVRAQKKVS